MQQTAACLFLSEKEGLVFHVNCLLADNTNEMPRILCATVLLGAL